MVAVMTIVVDGIGGVRVMWSVLHHVNNGGVNPEGPLRRTQIQSSWYRDSTIMPPSAITPTEQHREDLPSVKSTVPASAADGSRFHASSSVEAIDHEHVYAAHNYHPLPVVFARANGTSVWDPEGKKYLDFLSAYSAVNQGHCHPELVKVLTEQAQRLTLSSRAFYNDVFPRFAKYVTSTFGYDMVLPMNTGAEAVETAVKIARKWGYKVKGIPPNEAMVFSVSENFHGRTVRW